MTATLEQTQADLLKLVNLVQQGEEVVITNQRGPAAKCSGVPQSAPVPDRQAWLARLTELSTQLCTGKSGRSVEQILDQDITSGHIRVVGTDFHEARAFDAIMAQCYRHTPPLMMRTLDALHLAEARVAGETEIVTSDKRMRDAAKLLGFSLFPV